MTSTASASIGRKGMRSGKVMQEPGWRGRVEGKPAFT
jgi:hypothetical protein